jgi:hypothetical protein
VLRSCGILDSLSWHRISLEQGRQQGWMHAASLSGGQAMQYRDAVGQKRRSTLWLAISALCSCSGITVNILFVSMTLSCKTSELVSHLVVFGRGQHAPVATCRPSLAAFPDGMMIPPAVQGGVA